jgi:catechol 2,3-dioxygenase-like lactoylglutathione lyase family enzyme
MKKSIRFYESLGFVMLYGGNDAELTSFKVESSFLNIVNLCRDAPLNWWGRVIFYVEDVDEMYDRVIALGLLPEFSPRDARWGERYFHLNDPDGHELSFAQPIG